MEPTPPGQDAPTNARERGGAGAPTGGGAGNADRMVLAENGSKNGSKVETSGGGGKGKSGGLEARESAEKEREGEKSGGDAGLEAPRYKRKQEGRGGAWHAEALRGLWDQLSECMIIDRHRFAQRIRALEHAPAEKFNAELARGRESIDRSRERAGARRKAIPAIAYPQELPVSQLKDDIAELIAKHQVVVVCGETGSGKTTQLPKICLELGRGVYGMIGHTQPRRIAARAVAARIAEETGSRLGEAIGYKVRFGDKTSPNTLVKLMTDGILLAETQGDRFLDQYDTLIIDEAHERSLNIDFLLGYIKQLLPKRPDLKVIITSATIDTERFAEHFSTSRGPAPIIEVSGRTYPVEVLYRPRETFIADDGSREAADDTADAVLRAVDEAAGMGNGDVLVFLPGEREIRECAEVLRKHHVPGAPGTTILPLYARLTPEEQQRVFQSHSARRIVLATNVAETSLTVPGIRYVIDPGEARIKRYTARNKMHRLEIEAISRASAQQRAGRCGRVGPGVCIRLYSEEDFKSRPEFTDPEILRTNLASVILQMKALGLGGVEEFPFVEAPDGRQIRDGYETLRELGAVDAGYQITEVGRNLAKLPVDPRVGRMILAGHKEGCLSEVLIIAAALSVQDPRDRRYETMDAADAAHALYQDERSDFMTLLNIWDWYKQLADKLSRSKLIAACKQRYISWQRMREWSEVHQQLHALVADMGFHPQSRPTDYDGIHKALMTGLLVNVGTKNPNSSANTPPGEYVGTHGSRFFIFPGSALFKPKPKWVMSAEVVRTTKNYARTTGTIDPRWIEEIGAHLLSKSHTSPHWDYETQRVMALEKVTLFGLELASERRVNYGPINPEAARELFIHHALVEGEFKSDARFFVHNQKLAAEVEKLEEKARKRDILVDMQARFDFYDKRLPQDVFDANTFDRWHRQAHQKQPGLLFMTRADLMLHAAEGVTAEQFPDALKIAGSRLKLDYVLDHARPDDGVTMNIPLEALNQVDEKRAEWLVPGLVPDKIEALLKSIPKAARRHVGPTAEAAAQIANRLTFGEGDLRDQARKALEDITNVEMPKAVWEAATVPDSLRMHFRVLDEKGKLLAEGRDLATIRRELGAKVEATFSKIGGDSLHQDGLKDWSFGEIPEKLTLRRGGMDVIVYPAVIDQHTGVGTRVVETLERASDLTWKGLRRLFLIKAGREIKHRLATRSGVERMAAQYAMLGQFDDLKADIYALIAERAFLHGRPVPRSKDQFEARLEQGWEAIPRATDEIAAQAEAILTGYQGVRLAFESLTAPAFKASLDDMRDQLQHLVYKGFLTATPAEWVQHLPRYLAGIRARASKLPGGGVPRDAKLLAEVMVFWRAAKARVDLHDKAGVTDSQLALYRWMVEEYRIATFAQELRTVVSVSAKRLQEQWERIGKP